MNYVTDTYLLSMGVNTPEYSGSGKSSYNSKQEPEYDIMRTVLCKSERHRGSCAFVVKMIIL
jgi:hypothetical protein